MSASSPIPDDRVLVLDFGAQYSQLIARKVREQHVYAEIVPGTLTADELARRRPKGLILSGGPASVYTPGAPQADPAIFELGVPVLGICYGHQLMTHLLGGAVDGAADGDLSVGDGAGSDYVNQGGREYGEAVLTWLDESPLDAGLPRSMVVWMSHGDAARRLPEGFRPLAGTNACEHAAVGDPERRLYGVQFHPEVTHTPDGSRLLSNFVHDICGCGSDWDLGSFIDQAVASIRETVGDERVLCALSGGVDSAVTAALVQRAIGERLTCLFVDHGLLRAGEVDEVRAAFGDGSDHAPELIVVDASQRFLNALSGVNDPEQKRKIIGHEFIEVFTEAQAAAGSFAFLAQGTIYPDVIESGSTTAATIKSHHNVGGLPENLGFQLVEPLRWLFKDEVRQVGLELGLPRSMVYRQPFPGPGLAVRCLDAVTPDKIRIVRDSDRILRDEVAAAGLDQVISQYFTVLAPVRSVGVMGDQRTYAFPVIVRAVTTEDYMTARPARLPHELLERLATRIVNEVEGVNRCLFDLTSKPPATIEWE